MISFPGSPAHRLSSFICAFFSNLLEPERRAVAEGREGRVGLDEIEQQCVSRLRVGANRDAHAGGTHFIAG